MSITVGDTMPSVTFKYLTDEGMKESSTDALFKGKKVVMFALPGAFTPTCSLKHLPGFVEKAEAFKAKGVDEIVCLSVNDPFVMRAWGKANETEGKVFLLPDGNGTLAKALDLTMDGSGAGLGLRTKRFAMVIEDGVVKTLAVEPAPGEMTVSGADEMLNAV